MPLPLTAVPEGDLLQAQPRAALLAALKAGWAAEREAIAARFRADLDGEASAAALAALTDRLVQGLFDLADARVFPAANPTRGEVLSLLAVGGYGRGEMAPYSDIDLLFLLPWKTAPRAERIAEWMLYLLWDMGLKVGHAVRSAEDCLRMARSDSTVRTALLEARHVAGAAEPVAELLQRFRAEVTAGSHADFTRAKLEERDKRHRRLGDSRYMLEPDIKDGKGGLRDLHALLWIARDRSAGGEPLAALTALDLLTAQEAQRFRRARRFLLRLRTALHWQANRAEERLSFEHQPAIAASLRYRDGGPQQRPAARLMRHYFLVARDLGFLTGLVLARLDPDAREAGSRPWFSFARPVDGFPVRSGRLQPVAEDRFGAAPLDLIRVFRTAQKAQLELSPLLVAQLLHRHRLVDAALRQDAAANALLVDILEGPQPERMLRLMSDTGILGRFVPDWARVTAQTQHDFYHVYTVDEHTLIALGLLDGLRRGSPDADIAVGAKTVQKLGAASYRTLAVALFLHDIAKGRGGDHSILGAEVALQLCPRFGLPAEQVETVAWLVREHLTLSQFAQRRDPSDPQTLQDFMDIVQSPERLRLLYALTLCDIRAVGPGRLTDWKRSLLGDLVRATEAALSGGFDSALPQQPAALEAQLAPLLPDWTEAQRSAIAARMPPAFWRQPLGPFLAQQARMLAAVAEGSRPFGLLREDDPARGTSDIAIAAADRPGLFARLTGALALAGASIVDARAFTTADGWVLDIFRVQAAGGGPFAGQGRLARLEGILTQMFGPDAAAGEDPLAALRDNRPALPARLQTFPVEPRVRVDNTASATHTLVEVNGQDRPGLLHDIAGAMAAEGIQIASARIATFGARAVDVFYIKDRSGVKLLSPKALERLTAGLLAALRAD